MKRHVHHWIVGEHGQAQCIKRGCPEKKRTFTHWSWNSGGATAGYHSALTVSAFDQRRPPTMREANYE